MIDLDYQIQWVDVHKTFAGPQETKRHVCPVCGVGWEEEEEQSLPDGMERDVWAAIMASLEELRDLQLEQKKGD